MADLYNFDGFLKKIARGVPPKVACQSARIPFKVYAEKYSTDEKFALDVDEMTANALEHIIMSLFSEASLNGKLALDYLKKRDAENWDFNDRKALVRVKERVFLLKVLKDCLPSDIYSIVIRALSDAFEDLDE